MLECRDSLGCVCLANTCIAFNKIEPYLWADFCCQCLQGYILHVCRIIGCVAVVFLCWDVRPVFYFIWAPLQWLMGYSDPRQPTSDLLHGTALLMYPLPVH